MVCVWGVCASVSDEEEKKCDQFYALRSGRRVTTGSYVCSSVGAGAEESRKRCASAPLKVVSMEEDEGRERMVARGERFTKLRSLPHPTTKKGRPAQLTVITATGGECVGVVAWCVARYAAPAPMVRGREGKGSSLLRPASSHAARSQGRIFLTQDFGEPTHNQLAHAPSCGM